MLTIDAVEEFKKLYLKEYGISLSSDQALDLGTKLIRFVKVVYGSNIPKKWVRKIDRDKMKGLG